MGRNQDSQILIPLHLPRKPVHGQQQIGLPPFAERRQSLTIADRPHTQHKGERHQKVDRDDSDPVPEAIDHPVLIPACPLPWEAMRP